MKRQIICVLTVGLLMMGTSLCWAGPVAVPVESRFEFEPMVEGQNLIHEFIIKNQGDTDLNILGVLPP